MAVIWGFMISYNHYNIIKPHIHTNPQTVELLDFAKNELLAKVA